MGLGVTAARRRNPDSSLAAEEGGWLCGRCRVGEDSRRRTSEASSGSRHYKEGDPDFSPVPEKKKSIADAEEENPRELLFEQFFCYI